MQRSLALLCGLAVVAGLACLFRLASSRAMDDDELQHMHFAWCLTQGQAPYRDFWDNHPPLLHHLLAAVIRRAGESSAAFVAARYGTFILALPAVIATIVLGRIAFHPAVGWCAGAWLACNEIFLLKAIEIRPDGLAAGWTTAGLALLAAHLRAVERRETSPSSARPDEPGPAEPRQLVPHRHKLSWMLPTAGISLGLAFVTGTKSLALAGAALAAFAGSLPPGPARRSPAAYGVLACLAGFVIPPGIWFLASMAEGAALSAWRMTVWENLTYPQRFNPWTLVRPTEPYALLAAAAIGVIALLRGTADAPRASLFTGAQARARVFVVSCTALALVMYAMMPAAYLQSALLALPGLCVLAGWGTWAVLQARMPIVRRFGRWIAWVGAAAFVAFGVVQPLWRVTMRLPTETPQWAAALALVDRLQGMTGDADVVFDGRCQVVFRRHAGFYPALVQGLLLRNQAGGLKPAVTGFPAETAPTVVLKDSRNAKLPREAWEAMDANYVPLPPSWDWMLLPGWRIQPPEGAVEMATRVRPPVAGVYSIERSRADTRVYVDDVEVRDQAHLSRRPYTLRLAAPIAPVVIRRYPGQAPPLRGQEEDALTSPP